MSSGFWIEGGNKEFNEKLSLLEKSGFKHVFDRDIFVNKKNSTIVSIEYIQDNNINKLQEIFSPNTKKTPKIFF